MSSELLQRSLANTVDAALKFISQNCKRMLYPSKSFKASPDYYALTTRVLLSSQTIGRDEIFDLFRAILKNQRQNGSWPEILASGRTEENSVVVTSSTGSRLLDIAEELNGSVETEISKQLQEAADFVASREIGDGWFRKSDNVSIDTVNVDALASLFLVKSYRFFNQNKYLDSALRGIRRVIKSQKQDGEFFYYAGEPMIPSIFYHAITTNCLVEFYKEHPNHEVLRSALAGASWMQKHQTPSGQFSWRKSIDHWTYRDFATYAFALGVFKSLFPHSAHLRVSLRRVLAHIFSSQAGDGSFPIKDTNRTLSTLREDLSNITNLARTLNRKFPQSFLITTRVLFYDIRIPSASISYPLLNGWKRYNLAKFLTTAEVAESLLKYQSEGLR